MAEKAGEDWRGRWRERVAMTSERSVSLGKRERKAVSQEEKLIRPS